MDAPTNAAVNRAARTTAHSPVKSWIRAWHGLGFVRLWRPRHGRVLKVRPAYACIGAAVLITGGATFGTFQTGGAQAASPTTGGGSVSIMSRMAKEFATRARAVVLPAATTAPAPAPPSLAGAPALKSHEIFGFAPYWTLPISSAFDVSDLTTIAYFSVDVNGNGTIQNSGPGWNGYESQDLANLITRAHAAGSRVVLTATCFGQSALNQLTSDPAAAKELSTSLIQLISAKNLDGVNLDFEGEGNGDQAGLNTLVAQVSAAVKGTNPHWQVTMDTYASSAGDPGGFYDIAGLAPSVDAFFVMAYDMNATSPSPTAALTGSGFTDLDALQEYTAVVPASKVILGVPYYGYDWPTSGPDLGAAATGPPTPLSYAQITAAKHPLYWDPTTQTAWTSYQVGTQWHQTWYDDPTSLALKAQLANWFHIAGVGVWALGMDGNSPAMLSALLGNAPVVKNFVAGPSKTTTATPGASTTTSTTGEAGTTYSYSGVWNESSVALTPVDLASLPDAGEGEPVGVLADFATDDPAVGCLTEGGPLAVSELLGEPGVFVVTAQTPVDCADGTWTFTAPTGPGGGSGPTTTTTSTTSTTTTSTTSTTSTTTTSTTSTTTTTTTP
jgi:spore germination protein YaaH